MANPDPALTDLTKAGFPGTCFVKFDKPDNSPGGFPRWGGPKTGEESSPFHYVPHGRVGKQVGVTFALDRVQVAATHKQRLDWDFPCDLGVPTVSQSRAFTGSHRPMMAARSSK